MSRRVVGRRLAAGVTSVVLFVLGPGLIGGVVPWWLIGWDPGSPPSERLRVIGWSLLIGGWVAMALAFARFVVEGNGTPASVFPPEKLVVGGIYGYVRHPMYVALCAIALGWTFVLGRLVLLLYTAVVVASCLAAVSNEEPVLRRKFGDRYRRYCRTNHSWIPRATRWSDPGPDPSDTSDSSSS